MGAVGDKLRSEATIQRKMNDVEFDRQKKLQELEQQKKQFELQQSLLQKQHLSEEERTKLNQQAKLQLEKMEMDRRRMDAEFQIKKGELLLKFQTDIKSIEADLIKTRMTTQSSLFEKFLGFMHETLSINKALIEQQSKMYELALQNEKTTQFFLDRADKLVILDASQLIDVGMKKVTELNIESVKEMKYLQERLQQVLSDIGGDMNAIETHTASKTSEPLRDRLQ